MFELGFMAIIGIALFVVAGIFAAEMDSALMSVATFVIGLLALNYVFEISVFATFIANPLWIVGAVVLYVAAGAAYTALWRWPEFIRKNKDHIMRDYADWAKNRDDNKDNSFDAFLNSYQYKFNASEHKERLGTWVGMWPFSMTWELARKPAIWVWNTSYKSLGELFQRIGQRTARKLHDKG